MQRISTLIALSALSCSLAACAGGGSSGSGVIPQSAFRQSSDTVGGGPVAGARTHPPHLLDTVGGGPVAGARTHGPRQTDTVGGGPVAGARTNAPVAAH